MTDLPRTPWFGGLEHPVREGVYERKLHNHHNGEELIVYSYWDGTQWYIGAYSPDDAMRVAPRAELGPTMTLHREWRGLANES